MTEKWFDVEIKDRAAQEAKERAERRELRKRQARRRAAIQRTALALLLIAAVAIVVARVAYTGGKDTAEPPTIEESATPSPTNKDPDMGLVDPGFVNQLPAEQEPAEQTAPTSEQITDAIVEMLLAQGYLSDAVPLPYEYQDYMRFFSLAYGVPYPLALAVADYETGGTFNMDAVGPFGEVGIMQLYPGPEGEYHAELERATGWDPTDPVGNIACGCYLLGKYMDDYKGDVAKVAMAYNMGVKGAKDAWAAGITSTTYSNAVKERLEKWEATVNAWRGF